MEKKGIKGNILYNPIYLKFKEKNFSERNQIIGCLDIGASTIQMPLCRKLQQMFPGNRGCKFNDGFMSALLLKVIKLDALNV